MDDCNSDKLTHRWKGHDIVALDQIKEFATRTSAMLNVSRCFACARRAPSTPENAQDDDFLTGSESLIMLNHSLPTLAPTDHPTAVLAVWCRTQACV